MKKKKKKKCCQAKKILSLDSVKLYSLCIVAPLICLPPYSSDINSRGKYSVSESAEPCK